MKEITVTFTDIISVLLLVGVVPLSLDDDGRSNVDSIPSSNRHVKLRRRQGNINEQAVLSTSSQ